MMRFRRLLIGLTLPCAAALLACPSDDDLTDPFAPMALRIQVTPTTVTIPITDTVTASNSTQLGLAAFSLGIRVLTPHAQWTTSNSNVAVVDATGRVQALHLGQATITARINGQTDTSRVTVSNAISRVTLLPSTVAGVVGDTATLTASALGTNGLLVAGTAYAFAVNDPTVVSIARSGNQTVRLRFLKAGTTTVVVTAVGQAASSAVTVQ